MPLFRTPTTQELEDHFFGSGAFQWGWFDIKRTGIDEDSDEYHFPVIVFTALEEGDDYVAKEFTEEVFIEGIKKYAEGLSDRSFDDLIEDMDAVDVDNVIQLIMFGEIRYS